MRYPWLAFSLIIVAVSTPAEAQVVRSASEELMSDLAPQKTDSSTTVTWTLKLAPTVAGDLPWTEGDRLSDYQTTTAGVALASKFGQLGRWGVLKFGLDSGIQAGTDFDNDSTEETVSAVVANASVSLDRGFRRMSPFASYGYEAAFDSFLRDYSLTDHTFAAGATWELFRVDRCGLGENPARVDCTGKRKRGYFIKPSLERTLSSDPARERVTPKLAVEATGNFFDERLGWIVRGVGEFRRFDELDGFKRRDKRLTLLASIDFSGFLESSAVKEVSFGVRWIRNASNMPDKDLSRANLVPILNLQSAF